MRHKTIHKKALFIDEFVDKFNQIRKRKNFPYKAVGTIIKLLFQKSEFLGKGAFKNVYYISSRKKDLVLKLSKKKYLKNDMKVYNKIPKSIRNRYHAKIYWHTKYCLIQKWGNQNKISKRDKRLINLKNKLKPYDLIDIRPANVGFVDGKLKVLDALIKKKRKK